jgi:hypothetical protein
VADLLRSKLDRGGLESLTNGNRVSPLGAQTLWPNLASRVGCSVTPTHIVASRITLPSRSCLRAGWHRPNLLIKKDLEAAGEIPILLREEEGTSGWKRKQSRLN